MKKKKRKIRLFDACNILFMMLILLITIYPLYYTVIASLSDPGAVAGGKVVWRPVKMTLDAYRQVFAYKPIWNGYANSFYYTVFGTAFNIFLTIPAAYALSKKRLPFRNLMMTVFLITMYFGGGLVPTYLLVKKMNLLDTRMILILIGGLSVYNLIVSRVYFSTSITEALYEAAQIDGAGEYRKFFSIALPLAKPILAVMVLYYAVGRWNNYFDALIYVSDKNLEPLQLVLRRVLILNQNALNSEVLKNSNVTTEALAESVKRAQAAYTMKYAMVFIGSLPLLILYPFVQKYFVKGVMIGAVKE